MVREFIKIPMAINPKTGRREYTRDQLRRLRPVWFRQWRDYSELDPDEIAYVLDVIHTGPFEWPGTRIAEGKARVIHQQVNRLADEWNRRGIKYTGKELLKAAKEAARAKKEKTSKAYGLPEDDPFGYEYFIPEKERRRRRSSWSWGMEGGVTVRI